MPVTETWINPDVLRWARERLNLTRRQVAEESKKLAKEHFAALSAVELQAVDEALVDRIFAAQRMHGARRKRVEKFLRDLGTSPAASSSRNPLEQPWRLTPDEFTLDGRVCRGYEYARSGGVDGHRICS
jgi:hypothetical protein